MITIDVAEYCSACMDFDPDVQRPQKAYGMSEEIVISDTVIRCSNRNRCRNIERYLRKKVTDDGVGKTGEAIDILKKHLFQGHELDTAHMAKELGDVAWYLAVSANAIGYDLETIMQMNVDKLKARYPDGFDAEHSLHRNQDDI